MEDDDEEHYENKLARRGLSAITCRPDAGEHSMVPEPRVEAPTRSRRAVRMVEADGQGQECRASVLELVMSSKFVQWIVWAVVMALFTALTLAERWTDLALAMTVAAVLWYGIVPAPRSGRQ